MAIEIPISIHPKPPETGDAGGDFVYRGIHAGHPSMTDALKGHVVPGDINGSITPGRHSLGDVSRYSPFTSWTHSLDVARVYAGRSGAGGVILRLPLGAPGAGSTWSWEWWPDYFCESEILLHGLISGAEVWPL